MAQAPLISIIMPVYNNEKYFPAAVRSVLDQRFQNMELIIVDDGSSDCTPELADQFAADDSRIKVIHQHNQWIYASFNNGIQKASGEYIYILNSDDKLRPGTLHLMQKWVEKYHPDVIWTKVLPHICDENQKILKYDIYGYDRLVAEDQYYADTISVRKNWLYFYRSKLAFNQANLYRRSIAAAHKFRNDVYGADQFFNISIASDIHSAVVLCKPVYDHFLYEVQDMNVSKGRYFGYEHKMFQELYDQYIGLFQSWSLFGRQAADVFAAMRLNNLTNEICSLNSQECRLTVEEKLRKIFMVYVDDAVYQCARASGRIEELSSRVLSGCREILCGVDPMELSQFRFVYDYLDSILRYEKTAQDIEKIKEAVYHTWNTYRIGECFYQKIAQVHHAV